MVPGVQDAADGHVFVAGVGVVSRRAETDESLVSSRISRESRGFQSLSLSLDLENRPSKVSVSVSISKIGLLKSQSQSRSRIRGFQSLSLDLVIAIGPCLWTLLQNSY